MSDQEHYLKMGEPLDQLFNRNCPYGFEHRKSRAGGLRLPSSRHPGTGNIVVVGGPGAGKSTLAMQIAVLAACQKQEVSEDPKNRPRDYYSAYITLEESQHHLLSKARAFGWDNCMFPLIRLPLRDETKNENDLLAEILSNPLQCPYGRTIPPTLEEAYECASKFPECNARPSCVPEPNKKQVRVLLPKLSPRPFLRGARGEPIDDELFWARLDQIDRLLLAAKENTESDSNKHLGLVCIDSLNVLGAGTLTRDHLSALFDLFSRRQTLGLFVVEQNKRGVFPGESDLDIDTIEFLADMVIKLSAMEDKGYWSQYFQISKSRYQRHTLGRHPFKIAVAAQDCPTNEQDEATPVDRPDQDLEPADEDVSKNACESTIRTTGLRIYPSIHALVLALKPNGSAAKVVKSTPPQPPNSSRTDGHGADTGAATLTCALDELIDPRLALDSSILTLVGSPVSGKSILGIHYLLHGLLQSSGRTDRKTRAGKEPEDIAEQTPIPVTWSKSAKRPPSVALFVRLAEKTNLDPDGCWFRAAGMEVERFKRTPNVYSLLAANESHEVLTDELKELDLLFRPFGSQKIHGKVHHWPGEGEHPEGCYLIELGLKPGMLLPEEAMQAIISTYQWAETTLAPDHAPPSGPAICRTAIGDLSAIGVDYPFLCSSSTAGDLFLSACVHHFRSKGSGLVMMASRTGVPDADLVVKKAESLADSVIECSHSDVFGDRYITVTGPGLVELDISHDNPESTPRVLRRETCTPKCGQPYKYFLLDDQPLQGLVGFSSGHIRRPGVTLQLFEGGSIHRKYNQDIRSMVRAAMSTPSRDDATRNGRENSDEATPVDMMTFGPAESQAFHDSLHVLNRSPLSRTVIRTVDEYSPKTSHETSGKEKAPELVEPVYYQNILLLACDEQTWDDLQLVTDRTNTGEGESLEAQRPSMPKSSKSAPRRLTSWMALTRKLSENNTQTPPFYLDRRSRETLACVLADILPKGIRESQSTPEDTDSLLTKAYQTDDWPRQLNALLTMLGKAKPMEFPNGPLTSDDTSAPGSDPLAPPTGSGKAASSYPFPFTKGEPFLLLTWYTGLREILSLLEQHSMEDARAFARTLHVFALPGGGTKGDWRLQVATKSLSKSMGAKLILEMFDTEEEHYKRFVRGVGLPTDETLSKIGRSVGPWHNWPAWPGAPRGMDLEYLKALHKEGWSRSEITDYALHRRHWYNFIEDAARVQTEENSDMAEHLKTRWGKRPASGTS